MKYRKIPEETIHRLPVYLQGLLFLSLQGRQNISSSKLAHILHLNPSQIRKDFSYFGGFGVRGIGYDVEKLLNQVRNILKLNQLHKTALVGVGNLGSAMLKYPGFQKYGFEIVAAFDSDPQKIGKTKNKIVVEDISKLDTLKARGIQIAILAVPSQVVQELVDKLVEAGIVGILSFAPSQLTVPKKVKVISINIAMDLARLPYYLPAIKAAKQ